ncbi:hypothetical protein T492DRAFT_898109, partial [Pavlovales sp. CCMP2436]
SGTLPVLIVRDFASTGAHERAGGTCGRAQGFSNDYKPGLAVLAQPAPTEPDLSASVSGGGGGGGIDPAAAAARGSLLGVSYIGEGQVLTPTGGSPAARAWSSGSSQPIAAPPA